MFRRFIFDKILTVILQFVRHWWRRLYGDCRSRTRDSGRWVGTCRGGGGPQRHRPCPRSPWEQDTALPGATSHQRWPMDFSEAATSTSRAGKFRWESTSSILVPTSPVAPITATFITLSNNVHEYAAGGLPGSGTGALDDQPGRVVFRCKDSAIIRTAQVIEWILRPNSLQGGTGFPDTAPGLQYR